MNEAWRTCSRIPFLPWVQHDFHTTYPLGRSAWVPEMHLGGSGQAQGGRGGSYGRRTVATAERAAVQMSVDEKGLRCPRRTRDGPTERVEFEGKWL